MDRESPPPNEAAARARTGQQWPPDREACIRRRTERSERLRERESAGSAGVADAVGTMRSFTCNAPVRLHDGAAAFSGGERILVLLKELLYLSRDPAPGGSRELENSRRGGERRPFAAQANSAAGHSITLPSRSQACQACRAGYSAHRSDILPAGLESARAVTAAFTSPGRRAGRARYRAAPRRCRRAPRGRSPARTRGGRGPAPGACSARPAARSSRRD